MGMYLKAQPLSKAAIAGKAAASIGDYSIALDKIFTPFSSVLNDLGDKLFPNTSKVIDNITDTAGNLANISGNISDFVSDTSEALGSLTSGDLSEMLQEVLDTYGTSAFENVEKWNKEVATYNSEEAFKSWLRNELSAEFAREYQLEYDDTYYSRLIKSLKNAGLNPILAYSQGFGNASSAQGSSSGTSLSSQSYASAKSSDTDLVSLIAYAIASVLKIASKK